VMRKGPVRPIVVLGFDECGCSIQSAGSFL
jgi:hypothetical protein